MDRRGTMERQLVEEKKLRSYSALNTISHITRNEKLHIRNATAS